ncbi:MAG: pyridoxal-dependent decarboxylase [Acidobacteriota bacterium]
MRRPRNVLDLEKASRDALWRSLAGIVESYMAKVHESPVAPSVTPVEIESLLAPMQFDRQIDPRVALGFVAENLTKHQVHTPHARYFGLFNPAPATMGIVADALVAAFNPQLATWNHSPFAVQLERHLIRMFGARFGYTAEDVDGTFASGGAEANHTAVLTALEYSFPDFARLGTRGLEKQPRLYVSAQAHHSIVKAVRACGLGSDAIRTIVVDDAMRIDVDALVEQLRRDRAAGDAPFMIVANAGTTNAGVVDPIASLAEVAAAERVWFHVDAAWGGAAIFLPELARLLQGIELSDSITFDAHKFLSVPMAAGMYLTRHRDILSRTFRITTDYMPDAAAADLPDPYTHSLQWSRRFIGLKVFLSLAVAGWDGYEQAIRHQTAMGNLLRRELEAADWEIVNSTPLPIACFADRSHPRGRTESFIHAVAREVVSSGEAWISTTRLEREIPVLRACVTNYRTEPEDIRALVGAVGKARSKLLAGQGA